MNELDKPLISVIMGIYNCSKTLEEAVNCIIQQTYVHWELIMCDDGSTDNTLNLAKQLERKEKRIKLIVNSSNKGLNYTLNHCLKYANGEYIARMDGDDLCDFSRFDKQLNVLFRNPTCSIVSSAMYYFDEFGVFKTSKPIVSPKPSDFMNGTPFCHAPCLVKKEAYDAVDGYSISNMLLRVEDYHLWVKMYEKGYRGINILEPLYSMRDDRNAYTRRKFKFRINEFYVRILAVRKLRLSYLGYIYALRPIIIGLLPSFLYNYLHRK